MTEVHLRGTLRCRDDAEAAIVRAQLPAHLALTRAEPGCLAFEVIATDDPLVWAVEERFDGPESFTAHQARAGSSTWGRETLGIERRYEVIGI